MNSLILICDNHMRTKEKENSQCLMTLPLIKLEAGSFSSIIYDKSKANWNDYNLNLRLDDMFMTCHEVPFI